MAPSPTGTRLYASTGAGLNGNVKSRYHEAMRFDDPEFLARDVLAEIAAGAGDALPIPEDAPEFVTEHRVVMVRGLPTYPGGVRPYWHHWETPTPDGLAQPGDVFATEDLADVCLIPPRGGRASVVRSRGESNARAVRREDDGTLSIGEVAIKTVLSPRIVERFRVERGRIVYL